MARLARIRIFVLTLTTPFLLAAPAVAAPVAGDFDEDVRTRVRETARIVVLDV
jgi:hypothetical protein